MRRGETRAVRLNEISLSLLSDWMLRIHVPARDRFRDEKDASMGALSPRSMRDPNDERSESVVPRCPRFRSTYIARNRVSLHRPHRVRRSYPEREREGAILELYDPSYLTYAPILDTRKTLRNIP